VSALFFDGVPYKGAPTRVFAWYGTPKVEPGRKVPAMVLVHGGGGTAFAAWVRLWTGRGYAAIAMDTCGCVPRGVYGKWERDAQGGPGGWGGFSEVEGPITDQWTWHAIADVVLAHSLIRSFPEVDADRIGVTGISWGGYLTCITSGVDARFKFAAPVYGCGFLGDNSAWLDTFTGMGPEKSAKWLGLWDPSVYLPRSAMPMLWVTGTNDFAYPMNSLRKSYHLPTGPHTLCIRPRMPHGHGGAGENPEEIHACADSLLKGGIPLATITKQGREGRSAWVEFTAKSPIKKAELQYTKATGKWQNRLWESLPAQLDEKANRASVEVPAGVTVYYFNLTDEHNLVVSSEHVELTSQ
jgi:dienelactone hydrolase